MSTSIYFCVVHLLFGVDGFLLCLPLQLSALFATAAFCCTLVITTAFTYDMILKTGYFRWRLRSESLYAFADVKSASIDL